MLHDVLAAADLEVWRVFLVAKSGDIWFANQLSMFQNPGHPHVDYPKLKGKAANKVQDNVQISFPAERYAEQGAHPELLEGLPCQKSF